MRRAITYLQSLHRLSAASITLDTVYMVAGVIPKVCLILAGRSRSVERNRRAADHVQISIVSPLTNGGEQDD